MKRSPQRHQALIPDPGNVTEYEKRSLQLGLRHGSKMGRYTQVIPSHNHKCPSKRGRENCHRENRPRQEQGLRGLRRGHH